MFSVDDNGLHHTNDAPKVVLNTYSYITSVINIKIRRHLIRNGQQKKHRNK